MILYNKSHQILYYYKETKQKKNNMGRRRIEIEPIIDEKARSITFFKRKSGLFKKAHDLSVLCQIDIAVLIVGPNNTIYEFSSVDLDDLMKHYNDDKSFSHSYKNPSDFGNYDRRDCVLSTIKKNNELKKLSKKNDLTNNNNNNNKKKPTTFSIKLDNSITTFKKELQSNNNKFDSVTINENISSSSIEEEEEEEFEEEEEDDDNHKHFHANSSDTIKRHLNDDDTDLSYPQQSSPHDSKRHKSNSSSPIATPISSTNKTPLFCSQKKNNKIINKSQSQSTISNTSSTSSSSVSISSGILSCSPPNEFINIPYDTTTSNTNSTNNSDFQIKHNFNGFFVNTNMDYSDNNLLNDTNKKLPYYNNNINTINNSDQMFNPTVNINFDKDYNTDIESLSKIKLVSDTTTTNTIQGNSDDITSLSDNSIDHSMNSFTDNSSNHLNDLNSLEINNNNNNLNDINNGNLNTFLSTYFNSNTKNKNWNFLQNLQYFYANSALDNMDDDDYKD